MELSIARTSAIALVAPTRDGGSPSLLAEDLLINRLNSYLIYSSLSVWALDAVWYLWTISFSS